MSHLRQWKIGGGNAGEVCHPLWPENGSRQGGRTNVGGWSGGLAWAGRTVAQAGAIGVHAQAPRCPAACGHRRTDMPILLTSSQ